jgi:hypothetical protein
MSSQNGRHSWYSKEMCHHCGVWERMQRRGGEEGNLETYGWEVWVLYDWSSGRENLSGCKHF